MTNNQLFQQYDTSVFLFYLTLVSIKPILPHFGIIPLLSDLQQSVSSGRFVSGQVQEKQVFSPDGIRYLMSLFYLDVSLAANVKNPK